MRKLQFLWMLLNLFCFLPSCKNVSKHHSTAGSNTSDAITDEDKKYQYQLQPVSGTKYNYTIATETHTTVEANDKKITTGNKATIGLLYEVIKDSAGNLLVKLTYKKIYIVLQKTDMDDEVIDANKIVAEQTPVEKILSNIIGSSILLNINSKGNIISNSGSKQISDKVMTTMAMEDIQMKNMVQQLLNKFSGDGFIQDNLKDGFIVFPDTAVYIGDTWSRKATQTADISFDATSKYNLVDVKDNIAAIDLEGQISSAKNAVSNIMGQQVTTDLSGEEKGNFKTNMITGMLVSGKTNFSIKGSITVLGREVPVTIKMKKEILLQ